VASYLRTRQRAGVASLATTAVLAALLIVNPGTAYAASTPPLGAAENFGVLGATTVTNTGPTVIAGDVGVSPGSAITGFPPGVVERGSLHAGDVLAVQAHADVASAYSSVAAQASDTTLTGQDLGGLTLLPGVYTFATSAQITGELTLDAQGDPDAVFVFQTGSTLITASSSAVTLINGASACNVFWQVGGSATLGTGTAFAGIILANTSVTLTTNASIVGSALAVNSSVTLDTNTITTCGTVPDPPTALTFDPADESVGLTFLPPVNDGGRAITGYDVSMDDGDTWAELATTQGTDDFREGTVLLLTNGEPYEVRVRAVNAIGNGGESDAVTATPSTTPGAPTGLSSMGGNGSAMLTFTPPTQDGGNDITGYEVSTDGGVNWDDLTTADGSGDTLVGTVTGLTNGTAYPVWVRAVNGRGFGVVSQGNSVTPQAVAPGAPTSLIARVRDGATLLTFVPPAATGGSAITRYDVSIDNGVTWTVLTTTQATGDVRQGTVTNLVNGQTYQVRVRAATSAGPGPTSIAAGVTPQAAVPGPTTSTSPTVTPTPTASPTPTVGPSEPTAQVKLDVDLTVNAPIAGSTAILTGAGLEPGSSYALTMYSAPIVLAGGFADPDGTLDAEVRLPSKVCVAGGLHELVLTATAADGTAVSDTSYIVMDSGCTTRSQWQAPQADKAVTMGSLLFPVGSSKLTARSKATVRKLKSTFSGAELITVTSYTESTRKSAAAIRSNKIVSNRRAAVVRNYLKASGVKAKIVAVGVGGKPFTGPNRKYLRRAVITVQY
jgi:outer membrane protein OmpA-like peptidoglycan-associated protein